MFSIAFVKHLSQEKSKTLYYFMALIKTEIHASHENVVHKVLYAKSVLVLKKDAFQNTGFSHLKCQLKQKKLTQCVVKIFQVSANEEKAK